MSTAIYLANNIYPKTKEFLSIKKQLFIAILIVGVQ